MTTRFFLPKQPTALPATASGDRQFHVFEPEMAHAIDMALILGRPLLVRGKPGIGKSQLAHAAAVELNWEFKSKTIDSRTEPRDLLYTLDSVERLATAQIWGAVQRSDDPDKLVRERLHPRKFLRPGPLWFAFEWKSAHKLLGPSPSPQKRPAPNGCVVLLDEIDKGDSDVPNGLLEALGNREFTPPGHDKPVKAGAAPMLICVTTNEEKSLPDAFVRRCLVLHLALKDENEDALKEFLRPRARAHLGKLSDDTIYDHAAKLLFAARAAVKSAGTWAPGQAEYLDLLRTVAKLEPRKPEQQRRLLDRYADFAFQKQPRDEQA